MNARPAAKDMIKASDFIAEYLKKLGIVHAYGITGGAITHTIDSLCNYGIAFESFNHEQGAIYAASGATKSDNKLRVVLATSGPGATNLITGIGEAFFDSIPMLIITGQVNTYDFKWDKKCRQQGFQETDIVSIIRPITKYAALVKKADDIPTELHKAINIALSGRPGPVLLDLPMDVQRIEIAIQELPPIVVHSPNASSEQVLSVIETLKNAKRPLILVGNGCKVAHAKEELVHTAERLDIPIVVSLLGKGAFPEENKHFFGFIGAYGNRYANLALATADVILVIGARLDSRQTGNKVEIYKQKTIIHIDIDENEMGVLFSPSMRIVADAKQFLHSLNNEVHTKNVTLNTHNWVERLNTIKHTYTRTSEFERTEENQFEYDAMMELSKCMNSDAIACVDIGQVQMVAAQEMVITSKQQFITSGGMAPMGYCLPASIGIALETKRPVVSINGDGGIQLTIQELNYLARKKLPVLVVVFDNKSFGMIKQFQDMYFEKRYHATDENNGYYSCDFVKVAQAYGIPAMHIDCKDADWKQKLHSAFTKEWPLLVHITLSYDTRVYPKLRFDTTIDNPEPQLPPDEQQRVKDLLQS